jgi:hypothetical protein
MMQVSRLQLTAVLQMNNDNVIAEHQSGTVDMANAATLSQQLSGPGCTAGGSPDAQPDVHCGSPANKNVEQESPAHGDVATSTHPQGFADAVVDVNCGSPAYDDAATSTGHKEPPDAVIDLMPVLSAAALQLAHAALGCVRAMETKILCLSSESLHLVADGDCVVFQQ